jgi:hypothetical protein
MELSPKAQIELLGQLFEKSRSTLRSFFPETPENVPIDPIELLLYLGAFFWFCKHESIVESEPSEFNDFSIQFETFCQDIWESSLLGTKAYPIVDFKTGKFMLALFFHQFKKIIPQNPLINCRDIEKCLFSPQIAAEDRMFNPKSRTQWATISRLPILNVFSLFQSLGGHITEYILGAVCERMLGADQKKTTGSYYTPELISSYICKQAITPWIMQQDELLAKRISRVRAVRILDPAVGSGHFVIQTIRELLSFYRRLFENHENLRNLNLSPSETSTDWEFRVLYDIILAHNLFAIDINPLAVVVAWLRCIMELMRYLPPHFRNLSIKPLQLNLCVGNSIIDSINQLCERYPKTLNDQSTDAGRFDIIIGNPPYGNLLTKKEQATVRSFASFPNEIASVFLEQSIKLNRPGGVIAMIVTYAITFSKDLSETRFKLAQNYPEIYIATFDRDRCRFFEGMTQSVSILLARYKSVVVDSDGRVKLAQIYTTNMYRSLPDLMLDANDQLFPGLVFQDATRYILWENQIPHNLRKKHRIPKLGYNECCKFLDHLILTPKSHGPARIGDILGTLKIVTKSKSSEPNKTRIEKSNNTHIYARISGNYWYNAWDRCPYIGTQIAEGHATSPFWRDFLLLLINSSTFYLWFRIYSDGRHMNADIMNAMPIPQFDDSIHKAIEQINSEIARFLMNTLFQYYDAERNRFLSSRFKSVLDWIDVWVGLLYGFPPDLIDFIMNFEAEIRGGKQVHPNVEELTKKMYTKLFQNDISLIKEDLNTIFSFLDS